MPQVSPKPNKPKVLRRKGHQVEEALLFEDHIDEAAIEEWERKAGLKEEEASSPEALGSDTSSAQAPGVDAQEVQGGPAETGVLKEPQWRQAGKLRWLGIASARSYWEESTPKRKGTLMGAGLLFLAGIFLLVFSLGRGLWYEKARLPIQVSDGSGREAVLRMVIPLRQGRAGLVLGLSVELGEERVPARLLKEAVYDLLEPLDPRELKGPMGMERVRHLLEEGLRAKWPGIRPGKVRFLDYVIL